MFAPSFFTLPGPSLVVVKVFFCVCVDGGVGGWGAAE